jgi:hypothetical protein
MAKQNQPLSFNVADDPAVAAARAKLTDLQTKLLEADQQLRQADNDESPRRSAFSAAVDRMLGREPTAATVSTDEARQRVRVLEGAIAEQRREIVDTERVASERIAREALPSYRAIVKRMAVAMADLRQAAVDEKNFRESLVAGDVRLGDTIRPMGLSGILKPGQVDVFDAWLSEYREHFNIAN